jgi:isopentenyl diphosphate isomerase/L-lactate dehydrogenase-like FMN-dependent dehydrogenase
VPEHDFAALDSYQLIPRLLHGVLEPDTRISLLGRDLTAPLLPLLDAPEGGAETLGLLDADALLRHEGDFEALLPLLKPEKMGLLMPKVKKLAVRGVPGFVLDLTALAESPPYGGLEWHPRSREDLAELRAAAGVPLWLYGVSSVSDAEVASEAGLEGVVVNTGAGVFLGAPATAEVFPDIFDAVAGTISVYAGGAVRSGVDVFRYLALGAEAVLVDSDRSLLNLRAELAYAMRLTGCGTLADISYEAIFAPLFSEV